MSVQWSLALFTALTGIAGWLFACVAADEFLGKTKQTAFKASLVALIIAVVGGIASVTHLAHPEHMLNVLGHPTEGIFLEALLTGLMCLCGIVFMILVKREAGAGARKAFAVAAAVLGIVLSFAAGKSYMMASIPAWNTFLLPLGYLGTAVPGGIAAYLVVAASCEDEKANLKQYGTFLLVGGVVAAITGLLYLCVATSSQLALGAAVVLVGGVAPAVCGYLITRHPEKTMQYAAIALACAFVGAMCYRCAMWLVFNKVVNLFGMAI